MGKKERPRKGEAEQAKKREKTARKNRRRLGFRRRQQSASIYFLLWTAFSVLSVIVMLLFSLTQRSMLVQTYKQEASQEVSQKGATIRTLVQSGPPNEFLQNDYNGYVRFLSDTYGVDIRILSERGRQIHPEPHLPPDAPDYKEHYDYADEVKVLLRKLEAQGTSAVVYEGNGEYVYGAKISLYGDTSVYLHVGRSLRLMESSLANMDVRTVLLAVFIFLLSFAISSAVAGWLVNPIEELTKKAHRLAEGDFDVDFHGNDYGRELVDLAESLNFARDELSKTDRMQKELIANVSHDFKTPLTMIKGYASMIMEISGDIPEKRNKHAQVIVDEADRLASLVNDVLDLSKISAGITQLQCTKIDMTAYLYEVLDRFAYLQEREGYRFIVDADEGLCTQADEGKIGQVLYNLIGNAVNYTGEDKQVFVSLKREQGCFRFSVRDTGVGIKQEDLNGIWERYYRSADSHKRPVQGTGLGLSIVKTILERHGFLFGVTSEVGEGSTFYVLFPFIS